MPGQLTWNWQVLEGLGAPTSTTNLRALQLWANSEGLPGWYHNWLATFYKTATAQPARTGYSPPYYPTQTAGVVATTDVLGHSTYAAVVSALRADAGLANIFGAVNASPWCHGCQTGFYPIQLYDALGLPPSNVPTTAALVAAQAPREFGTTTTDVIMADWWSLLENWVFNLADQLLVAATEAAQAAEGM